LLLPLAAACTPPTSTTDTGPAWDSLSVHDRCFASLGSADLAWPDYDQFDPPIGRSCAGTNEQEIQGVQRLVFLGDSVTEGTPPTDPDHYYRADLARGLEGEWGSLDVENCARWGAEDHDLLSGDEQLAECFPEPSDEKTLVVMTLGGNDLFSIARHLVGGSIDAQGAVEEAHAAAAQLGDALTWFDDRTDLFPNGVYVVFANIYEYTDGTGDLGSCPSAGILGFDAQVPEMRAALVAAEEDYMQLAVEHHRDMIFMLEHFCGHGFRADDPNTQCYRGPGAQTWFDGTCLHPNETGHRTIANLFAGTILDQTSVDVP